MEHEDSSSLSSDDDFDGDKKGRRISKDLKRNEPIDIIAYSEDDMRQLQLFIQQIFTSYDLAENEIAESYNKSTKKFITNVLETILFVFFDQGLLSATAKCPTVPVTHLVYFVRAESCQIITVDGFHDEVCFGMIHENADEDLLDFMTTFYAPLIIKDTRFSKETKSKLLNELHMYLAQLTDLSSQFGSTLIFYAPTEGHDRPVAEAAADKDLVRRYENVAHYWISQIRESLSKLGKEFMELSNFEQENQFWVRKFETLSSIETQLGKKNIEHILNVIKASESLLITELQALREDIQAEIKQVQLNYKVTAILIGPLKDLHNLDVPSDVPPEIPKILYLIRVISKKSKFYNTNKMVERLFSHLSNEIIKFCTSKVDVAKIFEGNPRFGIKTSDASIGCCMAYKLIIKRIVIGLQSEEFIEAWDKLEEQKFFENIDAFIKRLNDLIDICETIIVFNRCDETMNIPKIKFGCENRRDFELTCHEIEKNFSDGLNLIKSSSKIILNIQASEWYKRMSTFNNLVRSLEGNVQSLLENVLVSIDNVEEALDALTVLHNFSLRKGVQSAYTRKVEEMWAKFEAEVLTLSKDIEGLNDEHVGCMPTFAGKSIILDVKLKKCVRLKNLLVKADYLPAVGNTKKALEMLDATALNVKKKIEDYNTQWSVQINQQPLNYLKTNLIIRSPTHTGKLECNIDRQILPIFEEATHFSYLELPPPGVLSKVYSKAQSIISIYNKVVYVVLLYNKIQVMLSKEEQLLFKEYIKTTDRKISPGMRRLTYDDLVTDEYIKDCLKHLDEVQHFVDLYKIVNLVISRMLETVSCKLMLDMDVQAVGTLNEFMDNFIESRNDSVLTIAEIYRKVIDYILVVYEGFEEQLNQEIGDRWIKYVRRLDALAEFALLRCAKNTFAAIFNLLGGRNVNQGAFISVQVSLKNKAIQFEPPIESIIESISKIPLDVVKSVKVFPRLNHKLELPASSAIKTMDVVVMYDPECARFFGTIEDQIDQNFERIRDFMSNWFEFKLIWEDDIESLITANHEHMKLQTFHNGMMSLVDVENNVKDLHTIVPIMSTLLDCSQLQDQVLTIVDSLKKSYKRELRATTLKKLFEHENRLARQISLINHEPDDFNELKEVLMHHKEAMEEFDDRKADMEEVQEFYKVLENFHVDLSSSSRKKLETLSKSLKTYKETLWQLQDALKETHEKFKINLIKSSKMLQIDVENLEDNLKEDISTSEELSSTEGLEVLSLLYDQVDTIKRKQRKINEQESFFELPLVQFEQLESITKELELMTSMWKLVAQWEALWEKYREEDFNEIDFDEVEQIVEPLLDHFTFAYEANKDREWDFLFTNKKLLENFNNSLEMFRDLQNPNLDEKDWNRIRKLAKLDFEDDPEDFNIKFIVDNNFIDFADLIHEISKNAKAKEEEIESFA